MDILILQVFVSFVLVAGSILLFAVSTKQRDGEHAERLALLPIETEVTRPRLDPTTPSPTAAALEAPTITERKRES